MNKMSIYTQFASFAEETKNYNSNKHSIVENVMAYFGLEYCEHEHLPVQNHEKNLKDLKSFILNKATDEQLNWLNNVVIHYNPYKNAIFSDVFVGVVMNKDKLSDCNEIQDAISSAIENTNNSEYASNKSYHVDDMTSEIFENIKCSKFCIFDLTTQNSGVYYEAGYAKAIGKMVILTVRAEEVENLHFDINHQRCILWNDYKELEQELIRTIRDNNLDK